MPGKMAHDEYTIYFENRHGCGELLTKNKIVRCVEKVLLECFGPNEVYGLRLFK
jgi:hypothetical protein